MAIVLSEASLKYNVLTVEQSAELAEELEFSHCYTLSYLFN